MNETIIDIEIQKALRDDELKLSEVEKIIDRGNAKTIKHYFCKMTNVGGAVMNPIVLAHFAYEYLQENQPNQNNTSLARSLAYLYACLCNEYCLLYRYKHVQEQDFFYIAQWKWKQKYMLGGKVQAHAKLLEKMGWIHCNIKTFLEPPYKREHYAISLVNLIKLSAKCKDFQSSKLIMGRATQKPNEKLSYFETIESLKSQLAKSLDVQKN